MNVSWLIENDIFDDQDSLVEEITLQGFEVKIFDDPSVKAEDCLSLFDRTGCVVFYGSLQVARRLQRLAGWVPGVFCDLQRLECTYYYPRFGDLLLNSEYVMVPFGELRRMKDFLFKVVGVENKVFIRPSSGFKLFTGKVVSKDSWEKDLELFDFYDVNPERVVVVAKPHYILGEWRFVIVDGKVVSGIKYEGASTASLDVVSQYAQSAIDISGYQPDPAWTIDICQKNDGNFYVLEVGSFSCAGLYNTPKRAIIKEVSRVALREWKDYNE